MSAQKTATTCNVSLYIPSSTTQLEHMEGGTPQQRMHASAFLVTTGTEHHDALLPSPTDDPVRTWFSPKG